MKTYLYPLLAGLLSLAACTNDTLQEIVPLDPAEEDNKVNLAEGTFIVDYSVDGDAATRAANPLKVRTLDYYVYQQVAETETYNKVKHRQITIAPNQSFPLKRENMTWKQRQALQDTLQCGTQYKIVFLANVDTANYIKDDAQYSTARILLPDKPFAAEGDYYYCLWTGELSCENDKEVVKRDDVLLQRIVTRTDVKKTDNPTTLYKAIEDGFYKGNCESNVDESVKWWINDFCERITECAKGGSAGVLHPNLPLRHYEDEVKQLTSILQTNTQIVIDAYKNSVIERYKNIIERSIMYKVRMQDWYMSERTAYVTYTNGTRANAIDFRRKSYHITDNSNEALCGEIAEDGTFSIIGFAGGENLNTVSAISFYDNNITTPSFTITGTNSEFTISQDINRLYSIICDPSHIIRYTRSNDGNYDAEDSVNLNQIMSDAGITQWGNLVNESGFANGINSFFNHDGKVPNHAGDNFEGRSLTNFPIHVSLPDITDDNVNDGRIELIPSWTYEESGNQ